MGSSSSLCQINHSWKKLEEEDAEKSKQVLIWCRQLFNKLRKIKDKESDHGRHMKGFDKLKVREPMSQVLENDDDYLDEAVHTKYFHIPPLAIDEAIAQLGNVDHVFYGFRHA
ncbi:ribosome-binding factor PSRP1, chloroplastic-like [Populus nigra]|uniref:ribosome-binding factor PSRP1, chloroplastic-like n=1 Tax=Populus nigra TaxID=3691 RepID=UPI002B2762AC|nr:ribosome-binding factor PSRP1, chloroplastic-like [Populus nigra]